MKIEVEDELPVVDLPKAQDEAYIIGRTEFDGKETFASDIAQYKDSAKYCNTITERLEALAGGDFNTNHVVVLKDPHDEPAKGQVMRVSELVHELDNDFTQGALDSNNE